MITVGMILRGQVPFWRQEVPVWVRVLDVKRGRAQIRITPHGSDSHREAWVVISEIEMAVRSGLLESVTQVTCTSCDGRMQLMKGVVQRKPVMVWACRECEEMQVI